MVRTMIGVSAAILFASTAYAEPLKLKEEQMDRVTAGFSINPSGTDSITIASNNAGTDGNDLLDVSGVTLPDAPSGIDALWNGHGNGIGDPNNVTNNP